MQTSVKKILNKVPEPFLTLWVIKSLATALDETVGDALSMSISLSFLLSNAILSALFIVVVSARIKAKQFHPFLMLDNDYVFVNSRCRTR